MKKKIVRARPAKTGKAKSTKHASRKTPAKRGGKATGDRTSMSAGGAGGYPPTRPFVIEFCSNAEGRPVADTEILQNLHNVAQAALNAAVNNTYHDPARVTRYPYDRPNMALSVRGAAVDIRADLAKKGVNVLLG